MTSIFDRIAAQKAGIKPKLEPKHVQVKPVSDTNFKGLGFTKREMQKSTRQTEREEKKALANQDEFADDVQSEFEDAIEETMAHIREEAQKRAFEFDESQERAIRGIYTNRVSVLIGAAGSGKTTITRQLFDLLAKVVPVVNLKDTYFVSVQTGTDIDGKPIIERMLASDEHGAKEEEIPSICGSSFTGRASQQFKRALDEKWHKSISTTHKLLGYAPVFEDVEEYNPVTKEWYTRTRRIFRPSFDATCKLPYTIYFIDEASMMPIPLFNELIDAMPANARIVLIGDINQLPPVMGKSVLGYAMQKWPVFELTKIHRQAADNPIIANAHRILHGQMVKADKTVHLIDGSHKGDAPGFSMFVRNVMKTMHEKGAYEPYRDMIIVANSDEKLPLSAPALNLHFVTMFNQERKENGVVVNKRINIHTGTSHAAFAVGDKVMILANINDIEPPITNGMTGVVESINLNGNYDYKRSQYVEEEHGGAIDFDLESPDLGDMVMEKEDDEKPDEKMDQRAASHVMTIVFDTGQKYVCSTSGDYRRVAYGYAATCHKMQGGEVPHIFIVVHSAQGRMLCREWLYTAWTRARARVFLIYNNRGLQMALKNQKIKGANIQEKIKNYVIESKTNDLDLSANPFNVDRAKFPILFNPEIINTNGAAK